MKNIIIRAILFTVAVYIASQIVSGISFTGWQALILAGALLAVLHSVIKRLAKQRKDSIEQFRNGGREDLAGVEEKELAILEELLPQMMSQDAIRPIAEKKKAELGVEDKSKMGILVGAVMKELGGQADGSDVKAVVDSLFN